MDIILDMRNRILKRDILTPINNLATLQNMSFSGYGDSAVGYPGYEEGQEKCHAEILASITKQLTSYFWALICASIRST